MKTRKFLSFVLAALMLSLPMTGCGGDGKNDSSDTSAATTVITTVGTTVDAEAEKNAALYAEAAEKLAMTELEEDGSYRVTEELLTALEYAEFTEPKNIIMMIGDGMGHNIIDITETVYADSLYEGTMAMHYMPQATTQSTYSADARITDSAAGGTALSTGYKTGNGVVGKNVDLTEDYKNVLELAAEKGKSTGIVVTKIATDATPATYSAHVDARGEAADISIQQLSLIADGTLDLLMGGGSETFFATRNEKERNAAIDAGATITTDWSEASSAELPIGGFFSVSSMSEEENMPTIAQMTEVALDRLSKDENGFFLMIEGSEIDSFGHDNNIEKQTHETYDFDCAVALAMKFVALNPDTVLIITADHETGGLHIPAELNADTVSECYYTSSDHTQINVPVYAAGHGIEALQGITENTAIAGFVASLLGEDDFDYESTVYPLLSFDDTAEADATVSMNTNAVAEDGKITVTFDGENATFSLPIAEFDTAMADMECVRAFHITVTNEGDSPAPVPMLTAITPKTENEAVAAFRFMEPGESVTFTYTLPEAAWNANRLRNMNELTFSFAEGTAPDCTLSFDDLFVTERALGY